MKATLTAIAITAICCVPLRADVTLVQTVTTEGPAAAMAGASMTLKATTRIKGMRARGDMEMTGLPMMSTLIDLALKQGYLLRPDRKTAMLMPAMAAPVTQPAIDISFKPTGGSQSIQNVLCDEYALAITMSMSDMTSGPLMPPEAAAVMEGVKMVIAGSMWIAKSGPGTADYVAFQKAAADGGMGSLMAGAFGQGANGMSRMMSAIAEVPGIPYLSELNMTMEGTGPMVEKMRQMVPMKVTTTVTSVSTDPISDDAFRIPPDYKIVK